MQGSWTPLEGLSEVGKRYRTDVSAGHSVRSSRTKTVKAQQRTRTNCSAAFIRARVDGRWRLCLLDSGADVSLTPKKWIDLTRVKPTQQNLLAANETQVVIDGEIRLPVTVGSTRTFANFLVSPNVSDVILGRDWLVENNVTWQFGESAVQIHGRRHPLVNKEESHRQCWCAVKSATNISPRSEAIVTAYIVRSSLNLNITGDNWSTVLTEPKRGLRVARSLTEINAPYANIRVCNVTDRPIQLSEGQTLSLLQPVDVLDKSPQLNEPTASSCSSEIIQQMVNRVDPTVPQETKTKLVSLLSSYVDVFSLNEFDLGSTDLVQHQINTGHNKPFRQPLRPQARVHPPVIDKLLQEMQKQGVIEPCTSEWASNIVLVKKKDGSYRFCVDYRKLHILCPA